MRRLKNTGFLARKKARIGDLASAAVIVSIVSLKAPRRFPRKPVARGQSKPIGSSFDDSNPSPKEGKGTMLSSLREVDVGKEMMVSPFLDKVLAGQPRVYVNGTTEMTLEVNPKPAAIDTGNQEYHHPSYFPRKVYKFGFLLVSKIRSGSSFMRQ
ncbi:hypothetical protein ACFE04_009855 [Oxalis oulophora]